MKEFIYSLQQVYGVDTVKMLLLPMRGLLLRGNPCLRLEAAERARAQGAWLWAPALCCSTARPRSVLSVSVHAPRPHWVVQGPFL